MKLTKRPFGALENGTAVHCWTMENEHGLRAELLDYGATIRSLQVPDRYGVLTDVVLGYDTLEGYVKTPGYLGATIGRFANRIGGASFELNGKSYPLAKNNGVNHLHGGLRGFDKYVWDAHEEADGLVFSRVSPDGEEGYPGTLTLSVRFCWKGDSFCIHYHAETDQDTILNLTNHSYFNLNGKGDVQKQLLKIHADLFTPNDDVCLPTGEIRPVAGTAMDFRRFKAIGQDADNDEDCVRASRGYDANFILDGSIPAVTARSPESGIVMQVTTDQPGVQLYTANGMGPVSGKNGQVYGHRAAFCLETQHYPDCIHHPDWPSCILRAGKAFDSATVYAFSVDE